MTGAKAWWLRVVLLTGLGIGLGGEAAWSGSDPPAPPARAQSSAPPPVAAPAPGQPLPAGAVARFGSHDYRTPDRMDDTAMSPDGKLLAVGGQPVRVYEVAPWRLAHKFPAEGADELTAGGYRPAFSRDGRFLAAMNDGFAYVWDTRAGKLLHRIDCRKGWRWTQFCAFTPDNLLALSDRERLYFFDPATGREVRSVPGGYTVLLSPDGRLAVRMTNYATAGGGTANLVFVDAATGAERFRLDGLVHWNTDRHCLAFAPDGRSFALIPSTADQVQVWDAERFTTLATRPLADPGYSVADGGSYVGFTADGRVLYARLRNGDIARWDAKTNARLAPLVADGGPALGGLHALPDGKTLLTPTAPGWARLWDADTAKERPVPGRYSRLAELALAPDGKLVAIGDASGRIDLLDAANGRFVRTVRETGGPVASLVFSPAGDRLAVGDWNRLGRADDRQPIAALVLRTSDGKELWAVRRDRTARLRALVPFGFAADDRLIVGQYPQDARVWNLDTGAEVATLPATSLHAAPSPDGKTLATDDQGDVVLIDTASGKEVRRIAVDRGEKEKRQLVGTARFAWSADGRVLATTLPEDRVAILDPAAGRVVREFPVRTGEVPQPLRSLAAGWGGGTQTIRAMSLSGDGKRLAVAALQGFHVAVWDTATGKEVARLRHDFQVDSTATLTPDGKAVVTFGSSGLGYRWDVEAAAAAKE